MPELALLRSLGLLLGALLVGTLPAQEFHYYQATLGEEITTSIEKQLIAHLAASDEHGKVYVDRFTGEIQWVTTLRSDRIQFEYRVSRLALSVTSFRELGNEAGPIKNTAQDSDMPRYMDTGDERRDNARYDAYKAAWIAANPEEYEALTAPRPITPTE